MNKIKEFLVSENIDKIHKAIFIYILIIIIVNINFELKECSLSIIQFPAFIFFFIYGVRGFYVSLNEELQDFKLPIFIKKISIFISICMMLVLPISIYQIICDCLL